MAEYLLFFESGTLKGVSFPLAGTIAIGRYRDNDIVIQSPHISRHHARIVKDGSEFFVQDLGSKNGTLVNGQKISTVVLMPGDSIVFGDARAVIIVGADSTIPGEAPPEHSAKPTSGSSAFPFHKNENDAWFPEKDFAGCTSFTEICRINAGVFTKALSPRFGKVNIFIYYPGLCTNSAFRRLARYEAEKRKKIQIDGIPEVLEIETHKGLLHIYYKYSSIRETLQANAPSGVTGMNIALKLLVASAGALTDLLAFECSHGALSYETVMLTKREELCFPLCGVMFPERVDRPGGIQPIMYDISDICRVALFAATGQKVSDNDRTVKQILKGVSFSKDDSVVTRALFTVIIRGIALEGNIKYSNIAEFRRDVYDLESGAYGKLFDRSAFL